MTQTSFYLGVVHLALGDHEAFLHSEEAATRTTVVIGAAALTGASGGMAAPILAGVVAGVASDGILTGVLSAINLYFAEVLTYTCML